LKRLRVAYERFTSCSGCQLTLLNCEGELARLAAACEFISFSMASSGADDGGALDLALVEGSISRPEELGRLLELRRRADLLAAVGACALSGGVNVLDDRDRSLACARVYGDSARQMNTFPPQPLKHFVKIDLEIAGCPPEEEDYLATLGALARGGIADLPSYAVCMECRWQENLCLLIEKKLPCLGPVTRAGCRAKCPSFGVVCEGCRGLAAEANLEEGFRLLLEMGLSEREVRALIGRFAGRIPENHWS
jgi:coenzyme F420-reducing hydrogenase gamma subunit